MIVLLIENDLDLRDALALNMEQWGVTVLTASTAEQCHALLAEFDLVPDAILADHHLDGGQQGSALLAALQQRYGAIPCGLITATRRPRLVRLAEESHWALLQKPIAPHDLRAFLRQAFNQPGCGAKNS